MRRKEKEKQRGRKGGRKEGEKIWRKEKGATINLWARGTKRWGALSEPPAETEATVEGALGWELEPERRHSHCQVLKLKQKETGRNVLASPFLLPTILLPLAKPNWKPVNQGTWETDCRCWPYNKKKSKGMIENGSKKRQANALRRRIPLLLTWNSSPLRFLIQCGQQNGYDLWKSNTSPQQMLLWK